LPKQSWRDWLEENARRARADKRPGNTAICHPQLLEALLAIEKSPLLLLFDKLNVISELRRKNGWPNANRLDRVDDLETHFPLPKLRRVLIGQAPEFEDLPGFYEPEPFRFGERDESVGATYGSSRI
jgi:hypothetical protein